MTTELVAARRRFGAQLAAAVGKAFSVVETGDGIGGGQHHRAPLVLGAHFRLMLKIDIAAPAEQDQGDIEGQRGACEAHFGPNSPRRS